MTSDPAAPDAVAMLQRMHARAVYCANHGDVPRISSAEVLAVLRATEDERARHAEEVARLRDVHLDETRALDDLRLKEIASLRDQLREVTMERENRVAEMRAWGEVKLAGAQHEIAHLRDQLRLAQRQRGELHEHQTAKSVLVRTAPNEAAEEG